VDQKNAYLENGGIFHTIVNLSPLTGSFLFLFDRHQKQRSAGRELDSSWATRQKLMRIFFPRLQVTIAGTLHHHQLVLRVPFRRWGISGG
jgi:hypothetical protein